MTMKRSVALTAASLIALALAGAGTTQLLAGTPADKTQSAVVSEQVTGGPTAKQDVEMSEHGLAAMNDIYLARIAINDGYVDNAKDLLKDARTLLDQVKSEDKPVKVTAEVKTGDKAGKKETASAKADLIPIMGDTQIVEAYAPEQAKQAAHEDSSATAKPDAKTAASSDKSTHAQRVAAVNKARDQLRGGDTQAAAETLRLVELDLVSEVVSMPLNETSQHVDKAIALIDKGKLHEANLELKKAKDGLIVETSVAVEPGQSKAASAAGAKTESHPGQKG
jgi:hypothetical protein